MKRNYAKKRASKHVGKHVTFFDFKGLMAPVYTCFKNDEMQSIELAHIDRYAQWLKEKNINGILVNGFTGEGPAMGLTERIETAEEWWKAALKYDLIMMLHIGGAPLPDVLEMADHAESLGVHSVLCMPELIYKPTSIEQLVGYLRLVAKRCNSRPFFYYHIPKMTNINFNMTEFCKHAEEVIPNFYGLQYAHSDLEDGESCLRDGRVVMLGNSTLLSSGMMLGFESALMSFFNQRPDMGWDIYNAMKGDDMAKAREIQNAVNKQLSLYVDKFYYEGWVSGMKRWFDDEVRRGNGPGFFVGAPRRFF